MKHLIVLPGNSPRNRAWGEACAAHFASWFDSVWLQTYEHWETGEQWINLVREEERLQQHVATLPTDTAVYVFAKSIGSILAVNAIAHGVLTPAGSAFFGMPLDHAVPEVWHGDPRPLASITAPTIVFHNDADPTANYAVTRDTLTTHAPAVNFITTSDTTHEYLDFVTYTSPIALQISVITFAHAESLEQSKRLRIPLSARIFLLTWASVNLILTGLLTFVTIIGPKPSLSVLLLGLLSVMSFIAVLILLPGGKSGTAAWVVYSAGILTPLVSVWSVSSWMTDSWSILPLLVYIIVAAMMVSWLHSGGKRA